MSTPNTGSRRRPAAHLEVMNHRDRPKTIAANGEIVSQPYGPSRWASPRRYSCAHDECLNSASILVPAETHLVDEAGSTRPHNCCGAH